MDRQTLIVLESQILVVAIVVAPLADTRLWSGKAKAEGLTPSWRSFREKNLNSSCRMGRLPLRPEVPSPEGS